MRSLAGVRTSGDPVGHVQGGALQHWIFAISVTLISRFLILRDRLGGRMRSRGPDRQSVSSVHRLQSGLNVLDARFVMPVEGGARAGLLLCHGIGETVGHWEGVQRLLARNGVASLVFNYSGYGRSTGWFGVEQCEADAVAAFGLLRALAPGASLSILGYSLGSGVAVAVAAELRPSKLILCAGFSSLHEAAARFGVSGPLMRLLPPVWRNAEALRSYGGPVLVLHGALDRLFPPVMADRLAAGCLGECEVIVVAGLTHNGPMYRPTAEYWSLVTSRL